MTIRRDLNDPSFLFLGDQVNTVELFSGTGSFSRVARIRGHSTYTVDNDPDMSPDLIVDLLDPFPDELISELENADVLWMSPPCTTFSMASGNKHWAGDHSPRTRSARIGLELLNVALRLAQDMEERGKIYFIENPRARARWFLPEEPRKTIWYCKYGDMRAKPTDIWTNLHWKGRTCFNGNTACHHQPAPRGSKAGTQGLKGAKERGEIPPGLFYELFYLIEEAIE
jgi:hypothetical protein